MNSNEEVKTDEQIIMETLQEAKDLIETDKDITGKIVTTTLASGEVRRSYVTPYFIMDAVDSDNYLISFTINSYRIEKVAMITHLLTLMLYDHIKLASDNFVDINTNTVYYGDEAYSKYTEHVRREKGLVVCPVCEELVKLDKKFEERGHCKFCHKVVLPNVTYH